MTRDPDVDVSTGEVTDSRVSNIIAAFEACYMLVDLERGLCQHVLLNVLNDPIVNGDPRFSEALVALPVFLRRQEFQIRKGIELTYGEDDPVSFKRLVGFIMSDRPFLLCFLDNIPRHSMF